MGNSTFCKIVTPENITLKLCTRDYVGEITRQANFGFNRYSGASPKIGEIWLFFDCPVLSLTFFRSYAQVKPLNRFLRFMAETTCFPRKDGLLGG